MKEFKVGDKITLEVVETSMDAPYCCQQCFCKNNSFVCAAKCKAAIRKDGKNVIFKLVEPKK